MKKIRIGVAVLACMLFGFTSCHDNGEEKASDLLRQAEVALEHGDFNLAKLKIDSIRVLYPKAFEARKTGIALMQRADFGELTRTIAFLDSTLAVLYLRADSLKRFFVFEKDTAYQDLGNYFYPTQVVEKNINRSFLRAHVDEHGKMMLTSIYCGARNAHHKSVRVDAPDGTFAESPVSEDVYESSDLGWKIEKADYPLGKDGGVIAFVALNSEQQLYATFLGERTYKSRMLPDDKKAISELYSLSQLLGMIHQMELEKKETERKKSFVVHKMQENGPE